jgi:hypothetical protein
VAKRSEHCVCSETIMSYGVLGTIFRVQFLMHSTSLKVAESYRDLDQERSHTLLMLAGTSPLPPSACSDPYRDSRG